MFSILGDVIVLMSTLLYIITPETIENGDMRILEIVTPHNIGINFKDQRDVESDEEKDASFAVIMFVVFL
ncbi:MAG: hypothetical protein JXJ04_14585 [Spirochaetales bacterium]|nr:hypothetical protein [Spirochaetales bacterium]